jgi:hypothetical protein
MKSSVSIQIFNLVLLTISVCSTGLAQDISVTEAKNQPSFYIGLNINPFQSSYNYKTIASLSHLNLGKNTGFSGAVEVGYFFSKAIGISTGIGITSFKANLNLDSCYNAVTLTDMENEIYQYRVKGYNLSEQEKISFISIPLSINLRLPLSQRLEFYLQPGVCISFPFVKTYASEGIFSYSQYYPTYNVLLSNLPKYGLFNDEYVTYAGKTELKSTIMFASVSAGLQIYLSRTFQVGLGACYSRSLSNIQGNADYGNFTISPDPESINSMMAGINSFTTQAIGICLTLKYFLK